MLEPNLVPLTPHTSFIALLQLLPHWVPGKMRLARRILRDCVGPVAIGSREGPRFFVPDARESIAISMAANASYEPENVRLLRSWLKDGGEFIDVGANIGSIAIPVLKGSNTRALLIEALPSIADYLRLNLREHGISDSIICQCLCGEREDAEVPFWEAPEMVFGQGSRGSQYHSNPSTLPMVTLDALVERHALGAVRAIKVDVEGYEREVFEGAVHLLRTQRPKILFEFMDWAERRRADKRVGGSQQMLLDLGYRLYTRQAYVRGLGPLAQPLLQGGADIVAIPG